MVGRRRHRRASTHYPLVLVKVVLGPVLVILPVGPTAILGLVDVIGHLITGPVVVLPVVAVGQLATHLVLPIFVASAVHCLLIDVFQNFINSL